MDLQLIDETKHVTDHQLDLVRGVLEYAANYLSLPENTEMSVTLMDNKHIHEINKNIAELISRQMLSVLQWKKMAMKMILFCHLTWNLKCQKI